VTPRWRSNSCARRIKSCAREEIVSWIAYFSGAIGRMRALSSGTVEGEITLELEGASGSGTTTWWGNEISGSVRSSFRTDFVAVSSGTMGGGRIGRTTVGTSG
jgi:hypothetical protein